MKYLKYFESLNFNVKSFFKDKINWQLVQFIEDKLVDYTDSGESLVLAVYMKSSIGVYTQFINVITHNNTNFNRLERWVGDSPDEGGIVREMSEKTLNSFRIEYLVVLSESDNKTLPQVLDIVDNLKDKIKSKFNVVINSENPDGTSFKIHEKFEFDMEQFFESKINWKLFGELKQSIKSIVDSSMESVHLLVGWYYTKDNYYSVYSYRIDYDDSNKLHEKEGWHSQNSSFISHYIENISSVKLVYHVYILENTTDDAERLFSDVFKKYGLEISSNSKWHVCGVTSINVNQPE